MMRSERKTEKWRIPGKWTLIFLLILLVFYGYQNILAENYERQVVSWIGQTEKDRTVSAFTEPDEEAYQKGCEALKEAGYEETGKIWLEKRIRSYGIGVFVAAIGIICIVGLLTELHMEKRRKKALDNQLAEKDRELEAKLAEEKEFLHRDRQKMGTYMENISHQLKTPIAGILLNLEVLLVTEEDEKRYQKLEDCVKKVQWMSDMTIVLLRLALNVGGKTFAVLGGGADVCYPAAHKGLYKDLIKRGGILSEQPPGTPPVAWHFPARNRLISGLADVVLVMEAKEKSGSLITADMALEQGRDIYALPGMVTEPLSCGCNRLIRQGAGILLNEEDLLEELVIKGLLKKKIAIISDTKNKIKLETKENLVYSKLGLYPRGLDDLQRETGLTPQEVMGICVSLQLKGCIQERSKNYYVRAK